MPGNLGLRAAKNLYKVADTNFLLAHEVQETQTGVVAKSLEEPLDIERLFRHD